MLGGKSTYQLGGAFNDGKGQPAQSNAGQPRLPDRAVRARQRPQHRTLRQAMIMIWTRRTGEGAHRSRAVVQQGREDLRRVNGGDRGNLRFARNTATTSGASSGYSLAITASFGKRSGT